MTDDRATIETLMIEWSRGEFWNGEAYADDVVFVVSGPDGAEYHGNDSWPPRGATSCPRGTTSTSRPTAWSRASQACTRC